MRKLVIVLVVCAGCGVEDDVASTRQGLEEQNALYQNALYQNALYQNALYQNGTFENGYAIDETQTWQRPWARVFVGPVANGFSVAYSQRWGSALGTTSWTPDATAVSWVDGDWNGCGHPVTQIGTALADNCNPLVGKVCDVMSSCCSSSWTSVCVDQALALGPQFSGTHPVSVTGAALPDSHSACAAMVNLADGYCRSTGWDSYCVDEAYATCYARYVTRPRVESGRLLADACVEPLAGGTPSCPVNDVNSSEKECCRRSLVLNGVYTDLEPPSGSMVHRVQWASYDYARTQTGANVAVKTTMIPDPCTGPRYSIFNIRSCGAVHHLWQLAGVGKPLYPDCPNVANVASTATACSPVDAGHMNVSVRPILLEALTALTNTVAGEHHLVDLRYTRLFGGEWIDWFSSQNGLLPPDTSYDQWPTEFVIDWSGLLDSTWSPPRRTVFGYPLCKGSTMKRTMSGLSFCNEIPAQGTNTTIRSIWGGD